MTKPVVLVLATLAAKVIAAQTPYPIPESDFVANSNLPIGWVETPQATIDDQGYLTVVWGGFDTHGDDSDPPSIQGQRFDELGDQVGMEFQINTYTSGWQSGPTTAVLPNRQFVVVWSSEGSPASDSDGTSVQARRFEPTGAPIGGQFQVNHYTSGGQFSPKVVPTASNEFIVVWASDGSPDSDTDGVSIQAQRFDVSGIKTGSEFQVNSFTTGDQSNPSVGVAPAGSFIVVWTSDGSFESDSDGESVQAQRFDSSGAPIGGQFQVNQQTLGSQSGATVAATSDGSFMVLWTDWNSAGGGSRKALARAYGSDGVPVAPEFPVQVFSHVGDSARSVEVVGGPQTDFVVSWEYSFITGDYPYSFYTRTQWKGQRYDETGKSRGDNFVISGIGGYLDYRHFCGRTIDCNPEGELVVVWNSPAVYCSASQQVLGKRYRIPVHEIFFDGFESGDTAAWSASVP